MANSKNIKHKMLTAGKVLKVRRRELGKSIDQVSIDTKIQARYIELIEEDQYEKFDSDVFLSGFIKIYAAYLSLDVDKILALYRRASAQVFTSQKENKKNRSIIEKAKGISFAQLATPKNVTAFVISFFIISILLYLLVQFYNFQREPYIEIISPVSGSIVNEDRVLVSGLTEKNTTIEINGKNITLNETFQFNELIILNEGSNNISVKAIKDNNRNQETTVVINVKYVPAEIVNQNEDQPDTVVEVTEYIFKFEVIDEPTWIQVNVDGRQEFAQILSADFTEEFVVTESFSLSTGKPNGTNVYINGEIQDLVVADTGTASISCEIENNNLNCD